jgi:hypothetical protein
MKTNAVVRVFLIAMAATLVVGSVGLAQPGGPDTAGLGTASGGGYHLTSLAPSAISGLAWQVSGTASGGSYRLSAALAAAAGSGCCCSYLPCITRNIQP